MIVKITKGTAWYKNEVGNTFKVSDEIGSFRQPNGGPRVPHYVVIEENPNKIGTLTQSHLIDCTHAEIVDQ